MTQENAAYEVNHDATASTDQTNMRRRGRAEPSKRYRVHVDLRFGGTALPNAAPRLRGPGVAEQVIDRRDWVLVQRMVLGRDKSPKHPEFSKIDPKAKFVENLEEDRRIEECKRIAGQQTDDALREKFARGGYDYDQVKHEMVGDNRNWPRAYRKALFECEVSWQEIFQANHGRSPLPLRWARIVSDEEPEIDDEGRRQQLLTETSQAQMQALAEAIIKGQAGGSGVTAEDVAALRAEIADLKRELGVTDKSGKGRK